MNRGDTVLNFVKVSLLIWLRYVFVIIVRLIPIVLIVHLREGKVSPWLLIIAVVNVLVLVQVSGYVDLYRGLYLAKYHAEPDDPHAIQLARYLPYWWGTQLIYPVILLLLIFA